MVPSSSHRRDANHHAASLRYATLRYARCGFRWFPSEQREFICSPSSPRLMARAEDAAATRTGRTRGARDAMRCDAGRSDGDGGDERMPMPMPTPTQGCGCCCCCFQFQSRVRASTARVVVVVLRSTTPFQRTVLYVLASALDSLSIWEPHLLLTLSILLGVDLI
jgi:hypothetical protein